MELLKSPRSRTIESASKAILDVLSDQPKATVMDVLLSARQRDTSLSFPLLQTAMLDLLRNGAVRLDRDSLMLVQAEPALSGRYLAR